MGGSSIWMEGKQGRCQHSVQRAADPGRLSPWGRLAPNGVPGSLLGERTLLAVVSVLAKISVGGRSWERGVCLVPGGRLRRHRHLGVWPAVGPERCAGAGLERGALYSSGCALFFGVRWWFQLPLGLGLTLRDGVGLTRCFQISHCISVLGWKCC